MHVTVYTVECSSRSMYAASLRVSCGIESLLARSCSVPLSCIRRVLVASSFRTASCIVAVVRTVRLRRVMSVRVCLLQCFLQWRRSWLCYQLFWHGQHVRQMFRRMLACHLAFAPACFVATAPGFDSSYPLPSSPPPLPDTTHIPFKPCKIYPLLPRWPFSCEERTPVQ